MVGIIICEVDTIICDIGTINVRFYLLKIWYPHGYCRIFNEISISQLHTACGPGRSHMVIRVGTYFKKYPPITQHRNVILLTANSIKDILK
jgi:hypothetical protein